MVTYLLINMLYKTKYLFGKIESTKKLQIVGTKFRVVEIQSLSNWRKIFFLVKFEVVYELSKQTAKLNSQEDKTKTPDNVCANCKPAAIFSIPDLVVHEVNINKAVAGNKAIWY